MDHKGGARGAIERAGGRSCRGAGIGGDGNGRRMDPKGGAGGTIERAGGRRSHGAGGAAAMVATATMAGDGGVAVAGAKRDGSGGDGDGRRMDPKGGAGGTIERAARGDVVGLETAAMVAADMLFLW